MERWQIVLTVVFESVVIVGMIAVLISEYVRMKKAGERYAVLFRYFTTLSNVYAMVGAALALRYVIPGFAGEVTVPLWAMAVIYSSALSVTVTFVTVMVFLGPNGDFKGLVTGMGFHVHVLAPILAAVCAGALIKVTRLPLWFAGFGVATVILYSLLYYRKVMAQGEQNGGWPDFYGFNAGGRWKISMAAMYGGGLILSLLLLVLHNRGL